MRINVDSATRAAIWSEFLKPLMMAWCCHAPLYLRYLNNQVISCVSQRNLHKQNTVSELIVVIYPDGLIPRKEKKVLSM